MHHPIKKITTIDLLLCFSFYFKSMDRVNKEHLFLKAQFIKAKADLDLLITHTKEQINNNDYNGDIFFGMKVKKHWTIKELLVYMLHIFILG